MFLPGFWSARYEVIDRSLEAAWLDPDTYLRNHAHHVLRVHYRKRKVVRATHDDGRDLIIKYWIDEPIGTRIGRLFRVSQALAEWQWTFHAQAASLTHVRPICVAQRALGPLESQSCLILPAWRSDLTLMRVVHESQYNDHRRPLLCAFGQSLAMNHANHVTHRDFKLDNALVDLDALNDDPVCVIDWGMSQEFRPGDDVTKHEELVAVYVNMRRHCDDEDMRAFLDGYEENSEWFASIRGEFDATIDDQLARFRQRAARRAMRNATRSARRLQSGKHGAHRYHVFADYDVDEVLGAYEGHRAGWSLHEPGAMAIWRAANALRAAGESDNGVVGLIVPRGFGQRDPAVIYDPAKRTTGFNDMRNRVDRIIAGDDTR